MLFSRHTITSASYTDTGDRPVNEDSVSVFSDGDRNGFILCDGLGGHGLGDVASQFVTEFFRSAFQQETDPKDYLRSAFDSAQEQLMDEQTRRNAAKKMKTTAVCLVTDKRNAYFGHVGDSRLYVFQHDKVSFRTKDHSIVQMMASMGELRDEEIRNHPDRNTLLRVMGIEWEKPQYEIAPVLPLRKCQAFLLCSDGFWELINEEQMCSLLSESKSVNQWLNSMVRLVKENGTDKEMDNNSAIAVWIG